MEKEYLYALAITVIVIFTVALIYLSASEEFITQIKQIKNEVFGITEAEEAESYAVNSLNLLTHSLSSCMQTGEDHCLCNIIWDYLPEDYWLVMKNEGDKTRLKVLNNYQSIIDETDVSGLKVGLVVEYDDGLYCDPIDFSLTSKDDLPSTVSEAALFLDDPTRRIDYDGNNYDFYEDLYETYMINNEIICFVTDYMEKSVDTVSADSYCIVEGDTVNEDCLYNAGSNFQYTLKTNVCAPIALENFEGDLSYSTTYLSDIVSLYEDKVVSLVNRVDVSPGEERIPASYVIATLTETNGRNADSLYFSAGLNFDDIQNQNEFDKDDHDVVNFNEYVAANYDLCSLYEEEGQTYYCTARDERDDEQKVLEATTLYTHSLTEHYYLEDEELVTYAAYFSSINLLDDLISEAQDFYSDNDPSWNKIVSMLDVEDLEEAFCSQYLSVTWKTICADSLDSQLEKTTLIKDLIQFTKSTYHYRQLYDGEEFVKVEIEEVEEDDTVSLPTTTTTGASLDSVCLQTVHDKYGTWLTQYATQYGIPESMIAATIAWESECGKYENLPGSGGCVGLGQFCSATAYDYGLCDKKDCSGVDYRTDAEKSIEGIAHYLDNLMNKYNKYTLAERFSYAAYNAGSGVVSPVISQAKSAYNTEDPTWDEFVSQLDASDITYFSGQAAIDKVVEIQKHNTQIYGYRNLYDVTY
ncbi:MAG: transglycosylase SLT domain-containing protein [archaeon]